MRRGVSCVFVWRRQVCFGVLPDNHNHNHNATLRRKTFSSPWLSLFLANIPIISLVPSSWILLSYAFWNQMHTEDDKYRPRSLTKTSWSNWIFRMAKELSFRSNVHLSRVSIYISPIFRWPILSTQSLNVIDLIARVSQYAMNRNKLDRALYRTYLFDSFRRQHNGIVISNTHAVFNAYSDSSELVRPPSVIRNIYASGNKKTSVVCVC